MNVAGDLLDEALGQEVGGSPAVVLRRSRTGKIGLIAALALLLVGMRLLYRRRSMSAEPAEVLAVEPTAEPRSVREGEYKARLARLKNPESGARPSYRPYRARGEEARAPLALPPHVLAILARSGAQGDPAPEGGPTPYHAPGTTPDPPSPAAPDEPPEQRLDLVVPGFSPWRNKK